MGKIMQTPSVFSALRVNGKRAYELAREGKEVEIKPRPITIFDLKVLETKLDAATFEVVCSKGTYVRSLAHDMAHALGTVGVVTMLRRTACLPFDLTQTIALEDIKSEKITADNLPLILMDTVVHDMPVIKLSETEVKRLSQGQRLSMVKLEYPQQVAGDGVYQVQTDDKTYGLVRKEGVVLHPELMWDE